MTDITMQNVEEPTMQTGPQVEDPPKHRRKLRPAQLVKDLDLLMKIEWSKERRPGEDINALIIDGVEDVTTRYNVAKADWEAAGKPACDGGCKTPHVPPCRSPEESQLAICKWHLLKAYQSEVAATARAAAEADAEAQPGKISSKGKGKAKAVTDAPAQTSTPATKPEVADAGEGKKQKPARRRQCKRCGRWHSGDCDMPPCDTCEGYHPPDQPCPIGEGELEKWAAIANATTTPEAAAVLGKMLDKRFSPAAGSSGGGKNKGSSKKRPAPEGDSKGPSKKSAT
jgi:hypothetical protein